MKHLLKNKARWGIIPLAVGLLLVLAHNLLAVQYGDFQRISAGLNGEEANGNSDIVLLSPDGNVVIFASDATNLVPNSEPGYDYHYYLFNRQAQTLQLLDLDYEYNFNTYWKLTLSYDGRYLVHPTVDGVWLRDLQTGTDELVSVDKDGGAVHGLQVGMSTDARYVAFHSDANDLLADMSNCNSLFIRDRLTATTTCVPLADGQSSADKVTSALQAAISRDGSKVYFRNNPNGCCADTNLYLYEVQSQEVTRLDVTFAQEMFAFDYYVYQTDTIGNVLTFAPFDFSVNEGGDRDEAEYKFMYYTLDTNTLHYWDAREQGQATDGDGDNFDLNAYPWAISADGRYIVGILALYSDTGSGIRNFIYDRQSDTSERILNIDGHDEWTWWGQIYLGGANDDLSIMGIVTDRDDLVPGNSWMYWNVYLAFLGGELPLTATATATRTPTATQTATATHTPTATATFTPTPTNTATSTHTSIPPTVTNTATSTATFTPEGTPLTPAELLINGNMDDNDDAVSKLPDSWVKVGILKNDRVLADNASFTYAHSAPNTFQFIGTKAEVGVASKLTQQVNLAGKTLKKGDLLTLSAMVDQRAGIPGTPIAKAVVLYNNGTKQVYTLKLANPKVTGYAPISISKALTRGGVKSLKVELFYAKASGQFYIDDVSLTHMPASAALVPLP